MLKQVCQMSTIEIKSRFLSGAECVMGSLVPSFHERAA
jgi:hypothetical protein